MKIDDYYRTYINNLYINSFYKKILTEDRLLKKDGKLYLNYPIFFSEYFKIGPDKLNDICVAGFLYYIAALHADKIVDDNKTKLLPIMTVCQEESVRILTGVYGIKSLFWKFWNQRKDEFFQAVQEEKDFNPDNFTYYKYNHLADKKSALAKIAIDAIYVLDDKRDKKMHNTLLQSHYYFSVGMQIYDDIRDFEEDLVKGQFNLANYELEKYLAHKNQTLKKYDNHTLHKILYIEGIAQKLFNKAIAYFNRSKSIIKEEKNNNSKWIDAIETTKDTVSKYLDTTNGYLSLLKKKAQFKEQFIGTVKNPEIVVERPDDGIIKGMEYILKDRKNNFFKLKHFMFLSKKDHFSSNQRVHIGDVFQRALLCDVFIDLNTLKGIDLRTLINDEINYLLSQRLNSSVGGWSYFPTVKEIAPDADDLGQIMQVFIKSDRLGYVNDFCKKAIDLLFHDRFHSDGGIETWIVPKEKKTALQKKQEFMNENLWGKGPDIEVMANFLYPVCLYDLDKYKKNIHKSINYLVKKQDNSGSFQSRWYYGDYYGTYVMTRFLKLFIEQNPIVEKAVNKSIIFVINTQNPDGGWGLRTGTSDAINTSLALLTLLLYSDYYNIDVVKSPIESGRLFLLNTQEKDGKWQATNFIRPKSNDPYLSDVLTTSYALKALSYYEKNMYHA